MSNRALCAMLVLAMVSTAFVSLLPMASATNDPTDAGGLLHVANGKDWTVTTAKSYNLAAAIIMDGGNVYVANGGTLTLDHTQLVFTEPNDGHYGIVVQAGGTLIMKNNAFIGSNSGAITIFCGFLKGSTINIDSGAIGFVAGPVPGAPVSGNLGIYIGTKNITINKLTTSINGNLFSVPMIFNDADGTTITNSTLLNTKDYAIVANRSMNITDSVVRYNGPPAGSRNGIKVMPGVKVRLMNVAVSQEYIGITGSSCSLYAERSNINNNTRYGIYLDTHSDLLLKNTEVTNNLNGIFLASLTTAALTGNNRIYYNTNDGLDVYNLASANITGARISFNGNTNINVSTGYVNMSKVRVEADHSPYASVAFDEVSRATVSDTVFTITVPGVPINVYAQGGSRLDIDNSQFTGQMCFWDVGFVKGSTGSVNGSMFTNGAMGDFIVADGATASSSNNSFTNFMMLGLAVTSGSTLTSVKDTGSSTIAFAVAIQASNLAALNMVNGDFTLSGSSNFVANVYDGATATLTDSKFLTAVPNPTLVATRDGRIRSINTTGLDPAHAKATDRGLVEFGWHVDVRTQWQNGAVAPGANVDFVDAHNRTTVGLTTTADGSGRTDVIARTVTDTGLVDHNKYNVNASLDGMKGTFLKDITNNLVGNSKVVVTLKDSSAPKLNITFPSDNYNTNHTKFTMVGNASDKGSMLDGIFVQLDSGATWATATGKSDWTYDLNLTEGTHVIKVQARDIAGVVTNQTINVVIDLKAPVITIDTPATNYVNNRTFFVNGTVDDKNATVTVNGTSVTNNAGKFSMQFTLPDGPHNIKITAIDKAGNIATKLLPLIVDTIAPTLTSDMAASSWVNNRHFILTGKTDGDMVTVNGTASIVDKANGTWKMTLNLTEGPNTLVVKAMDLAGNHKDLTLTMNLDTVPPTLVMSFPTGTGKYYTNKAKLNLTGKVTGASILTLNGASATIGTDGNFTQTISLINGSNIITIKALDLAGNNATIVKTVILDTVAPKVVITNPKDGTMTNQASQMVSGTVDDLTAALGLNSINMTNTNGTFSTTISLTNGANTMTVTATDLAGNVGTAIVIITYRTSVALTITSPKSLKGTTTSDTTTIKGISDKGATVTINGLPVQVDSTGAFSGKVTLREGKNTVTIVAKDTAGNTQTKIVTVNYNDAKQYDLMMLLGLALVLMIIGLVLGLLIGMVMGRKKAQPPTEAKRPQKASAKPEPEEEEEEPAPPKEEPKPKVEPKPEPTLPKEKAKPEEKPKDTKDSSLNDILKDMEKK